MTRRTTSCAIQIIPLRITTSDGVTLAGTAWAPSQPHSVMPWIHGYAEHSKRYDHFGRWLAERGVVLACVDLRGHGQSGGQRGHIDDISEYYLDIAALLRYCQFTWPDQPLILGAHSNGALAAIRFLQENEQSNRLSGWVFSGPNLQIKTPIPRWKHLLAVAIKRIYPRFTLPTKIPAHWLTHNESLWRAYDADPLVFKTGTAGWYCTTRHHQRVAMEQAPRIKLPGLVLQGLDDRVVSPAHAHEFYRHTGSQDKHWIGYADFYHEILNELGRERVYTDILHWLDERWPKQTVSRRHQQEEASTLRA